MKSKLSGLVFFLIITVGLNGQDTGPKALRDTTPVVKPVSEQKVEKKDTTHIGNFFKDPVTPDAGIFCLLYTSPSPRDRTRSRMPSSA